MLAGINMVTDVTHTVIYILSFIDNTFIFEIPSTYSSNDANIDVINALYIIIISLQHTRLLGVRSHANFPSSNSH